ncbi:MAG: hypothetical protein WJ306_05685 [Ferrovum myxofaciens]
MDYQNDVKYEDVLAWMSESDSDIIKHFYKGIWGSEQLIKLDEIGRELYKVHKYANVMNTDADVLSQSIVLLTLSSYFAGCVPIIRIESSLFISRDFRNEYAYALAVRAYLEVAGRLHKGLRMWKQYFHFKTKSLEEFHAGVVRLLAKFQPKDSSPKGIFKGKGFNTMTLVKSLQDKIPSVIEVYENLSSYVHGGFEEQMYIRKISWLSDQKRSSNPIVESYEKVVEEIRAVIFEDFEELLHITKQFRDRYDKMVTE